MLQTIFPSFHAWDRPSSAQQMPQNSSRFFPRREKRIEKPVIPKKKTGGERVVSRKKEKVKLQKEGKKSRNAIAMLGRAMDVS
jgi:hypothetical protein